MTEASGADRPQDENAARPNRRRWRLGGAIGLAEVAMVLLYGLRSMSNDRDELPAALPLSSDPFSLLLPVPDLKFVDKNERTESLSDFKGRLILLNIWATWCLPCRKEMPSLDRLQAQFDRSKFIVLTLSIDLTGLTAVRKFYADLGLKSLGIYLDQRGTALRELGLSGIPGTLLINPAGLEIGRKLGPAEWDSPEVVALLRSHFGLDAAKATDGAAP
jgi:thiol-disulfide isomerase/thioredoxin